jgi:hypothetical protein
LHEILWTEVRSSGGQNQKRIGAINIRPVRWQRSHPSLSGFPEEDTVLAPGVGETDQVVFVAAQRMKRVRYTDSLRTTATAGS